MASRANPCAAACGMALFLLMASMLIATSKCAIEYEDSELDKPLYPTPIIDLINNDPDAGWTAGVNERFINLTLRDFKRLGGGLISPHLESIQEEESPEELEAKLKQLPNAFDARYNWNCPSMWRILDQGTCGACWAFSAVQALQDRFCTYFGLDMQLSVNNVLSCCTSCGTCDLGYLQRAYDYLASSGTVTAKCSPYFDTTACPLHGCKGVDTPACKRYCEDGDSMNRRYYFSKSRQLSGIANIMTEIINRGPVSAFLNAYEDLSVYKTGVYRYQYGKLIIGHFVKLVGWGYTNQGERYWIATNQWGTSWGEKGHFKIRLGVNECGIESFVLAADPIYPQNGLISVA